MVTLNKEHVICHSLQSPEGDDKVRKNDTAASAPPRLCPCGRPEAAICRLKSSVRFASAVEKGPLRSLNDEFPLPPTSTRYKHLAIPSKYCQNVLAWRRSLQEVSGSLPYVASCISMHARASPPPSLLPPASETFDITRSWNANWFVIVKPMWPFFAAGTSLAQSQPTSSEFAPRSNQKPMPLPSPRSGILC